MPSCPVCGAVQMGLGYEHETLTRLANCVQSDIRKSLPANHSLDDLANAFDCSELLVSIFRRIAIIENQQKGRYAN